MKNAKLPLLVLVLGIVASSCGKVEKILPRSGGDWKVTSYSTTDYVNSAVDSSYTTTDPDPELIFHFEDDGTGTYFAGSLGEPFTWTVNADQDEVNICRDISGGGTLICSVNTIQESSAKTQVWFSTSQTTGVTSWQEVVFNLERQ